MCPQLGIKQASFVEQPGGEAKVASLSRRRTSFDDRLRVPAMLCDRSVGTALSRLCPACVVAAQIGSQVKTSAERSSLENDPFSAGMPCSAMVWGVQPSLR